MPTRLNTLEADALQALNPALQTPVHLLRGISKHLRTCCKTSTTSANTLDTQHTGTSYLSWTVAENSFKSMFNGSTNKPVIVGWIESTCRSKRVYIRITIHASIQLESSHLKRIPVVQEDTWFLQLNTYVLTSPRFFSTQLHACIYYTVNSRAHKWQMKIERTLHWLVNWSTTDIS